jgi:hypothetical protein
VDVVECRPGSWYLLTEGGHHYLDVQCGLPLVDISMLVRLDEGEESEFSALGRTFLDYLAAKVSYWSGRYRSRAIEGELADEARTAIVRWQRSHDVDPFGR